MFDDDVEVAKSLVLFSPGVSPPGHSSKATIREEIIFFSRALPCSFYFAAFEKGAK